MRKKNLPLTLFLFVTLILHPVSAYAYIDPMSVSIILQAIIAGIVGIMIYVKVYWLNLKNYFIKLFQKKFKKK